MTLATAQPVPLRRPADELPPGVHREVRFGTIGWSVADLYREEIRAALEGFRYEIVEGVLTELPPYGDESIGPLKRLERALGRDLDRRDIEGEFRTETDLELTPLRVKRPDLMFLTPEQLARHRVIRSTRPISRSRYHPIYAMPELIAESISVGGEHHDRIAKRRWYAQAGIRHYWILSFVERSLECLVLRDGQYETEGQGSGTDVVESTLFEKTEINLSQVFELDFSGE
jgi:Uma2 family endonuclease